MARRDEPSESKGGAAAHARSRCAAVTGLSALHARAPRAVAAAEQPARPADRFSLLLRCGGSFLAGSQPLVPCDRRLHRRVCLSPARDPAVPAVIAASARSRAAGPDAGFVRRARRRRHVVVQVSARTRDCDRRDHRPRRDHHRAGARADLHERDLRPGQCARAPQLCRVPHAVGGAPRRRRGPAGVRDVAEALPDRHDRRGRMEPAEMEGHCVRRPSPRSC